MPLSAAVLLLACLGAAVADDTKPEDYDVDARPFKPATLICPIMPVRWFGPSGQPVTPDAWHLVDKEYLNISHVGDGDIGVYTCVGESENRTVNLFSSPFVKNMARSKNLVVDETANLSCVAWGHPEPIIRWYKTTKDNVTTEVVAGVNDTAVERVPQKEAYHVGQHLLLGNVTFDSYAVYSCNASNRIDSTTGVTLVRVKDKLAPLWPFIGIIIEVIILIVIIVIYEKRKSKQSEEDEAKEKADNQTNATNDHKGEEGVRQRK